MNAKTCPACSAEIPADALECGYCGSPVAPVSLSFQQREQAVQCIRELNHAMLQEHKKLRRQADLLFVGLGLAGILIIWIGMVAANLGNSRTVLLIFSALVLLGWRLYRRRRLVDGLVRCFEEEIEPRIREAVSRFGLPRWQFDQMAARELEQNDPLRKFMFFRSSRRAGG